MPPMDLLGICPPLNLINSAANIGCVAVRAVPVATLVNLMDQKKHKK